MPIVDDRGRVAGRANLIDAFVAIIVVVLVPVAYGAYLLFRTPTPKLLAVTPDRVYQGPNLRVQVEGENLRPFMRVSFNTTQGRTFLIGSTKYALIDLPDLQPGTYDVVLFDYMQEVSRLPKALTVLPLAPVPTLEMEVSGSFLGLADSVAAQMKAGMKLPPDGSAAEIVAVGSSEPARMRLRAGTVSLSLPLTGQRELRATLRVKCYVTAGSDGSLRCMMPGPQQSVPVEAGATPTLAGPLGWMTFQIADVHSTDAPAVAQAHVSIVASAEAAARMREGDADASADVAAGRAATVVAIQKRAIARGAAADSHQTPGGSPQLLDVAFRVPVERVGGAWMYRAAPLKIGAPFSFETNQYIVRGEVTAVTTPAAGTGNR